jgi:hypothetical protein
MICEKNLNVGRGKLFLSSTEKQSHRVLGGSGYEFVKSFQSKNFENMDEQTVMLCGEDSKVETL